MRGFRARRWGELSLAVLLVVAGSGVGGCRAEQRWPLWEHYTQRFMDDQGRVIDHSEGDRSTSEGQAYALFFSLVDNDRGRFEKVLRWTEANLADGDLTAHLPAWSWGKSSDGSWKVIDANSASDSDLWIAYSLIEAGRLWDDPRYSKMGEAVAARIAREEVVLVPGLGTTVIAGGRGFHPDAWTWIVNPSYLPLPVLTGLADAMPQGPWRAVIASLGPLLARGSGAGYAMDWVTAGSGVRPSATPAQIATGPKDAPAIGSYDAIRVYLWLGVADPATPGRGELLGDVSGMAEYLKRQQVPPEKVESTGKIAAANGPLGFSAALIPYLETDGWKDEAKGQTDRLAAGKDSGSGLYGVDPRYYDQNLALFSTGWSEERYRFGSDGRVRLKWK